MENPGVNFWMVLKLIKQGKKRNEIFKPANLVYYSLAERKEKSSADRYTKFLRKYQ